MKALLEVRGLEIETAARPARGLVKGACFSVFAGETTCVVGASGSGKSLSCLSVPGLLPPGVRKTGGEVWFRGERIDNAPKEALRRLRGTAISMVMQNPMSCFDPVFTIESHFLETIAAHERLSRREADEKMMNALAEVGFDDGGRILAAYPFQLSGGMLQRVMLAMALSLDPALLIADEPTSDLDTVAQARVLDLMDAARRGRNMGVLLVTHDFGVAAKMASSIVVMDGGQVVETGETGAIFAAPVHESARALVAAHKKLCAPLAAEGVGV